jgi:hypothetical protein
MAELKNMVMGLLALLFVASAITTIFSFALVNNIANGGTGASVPFPLLNQTTAYTTDMTTYSQELSNATSQASTTPSASQSTLGGGIGAITQAGTAAISLSFNSMGMLVTMITSMGTTLAPLGVPPIVFDFGILTIVISITFAILAAVFKWWL